MGRKVLMKTSAIIAAAGASSRMGGGSKLLLPLGGRPVIFYSLALFDRCDAITEIILVARQEDFAALSAIAGEAVQHKTVKLVEGGASREISVKNGVEACADDCELLCIQDGARPLLSAALLADVLAAAREHGAAALAVPVKDTIKLCGEDGLVQSTPDRNMLFAVQTPQVFWRANYQKALAAYLCDPVPITDDCQLLERAGFPVKLVPGSYENLKITTPEDIAIAESLLQRA